MALKLVSVHGSSLMKVCIMAFFAFAVRIFDGMDFVLNVHGKIGFEKILFGFEKNLIIVESPLVCFEISLVGFDVAKIVQTEHNQVYLNC